MHKFIFFLAGFVFTYDNMHRDDEVELQAMEDNEVRH